MYLPYFVFTFRELGRVGLGPGQPAALGSAVGAGTIGGITLTGTVPSDLNSVHTDSAPVHTDLLAVHTDSAPVLTDFAPVS
jgi:hypothetical protein